MTFDLLIFLTFVILDSSSDDAICAFHVLVTCLAIMVILTTACTCQFTTAGILPMSKLVTFEARGSEYMTQHLNLSIHL